MFIEIANPNKSLSHWPGSLKNFGTNLYNENIYRVVWSDSRLHLVGGMWTDYSAKPANDKELKQQGHDPNLVRRVAEYRWVPLYAGTHAWMLERWLPAIRYAGTPKTWDLTMRDEESGLLMCGPYPHRGEYEHCFTFPDGTMPTISMIERAINWVKAGQNYSIAENKQANEEQLKKQEKAWLNRGLDIWKDAQSPWQGNALAGSPGRRKKEDVQFRLTAEDLQLPQRDGTFFTNGKRG